MADLHPPKRANRSGLIAIYTPKSILLLAVLFVFVVMLTLVQAPPQSIGCHNGAIKTMAVCRSDTNYILCQDYVFECIDGAWLPVKETDTIVHHERPWTDPRTGRLWE